MMEENILDGSVGKCISNLHIVTCGRSL